MNKLKIAIIAGGDSTEREISEKGALNIFNELDRNRYEPYIVDISSKRWYVKEADTEINKNNFSTIINNEEIKFDYALINIHGTPGENGILQSYFELVNVPYSTCGVTASAVTFDKALTKRALSSNNIKMAKDIVIVCGEDVDCDQIVSELGLPIFVKPCAAGSSFGVTMVKTKEELIPAIEKAYVESERVILEEKITGTEISCGVMILNGEETVFPCTEIISETEYFDYEAKYKGLSKEITPARISEKAKLRLDVILVDIYKTLCLRGLVRIDFIVKDEEPYLIEVNTVPGMSAQSLIPQQAKAMGMTQTELFTKIIENTK
ncbi:MAG: D-alanine--D-alanine ligase [Rikenellaceae bacterium]